MGAFRGNLTFTRFFIRGDVPDEDGTRDRWLRNIRLRKLEPLTVEEEDTERVGWCAVDRGFDLDLDHNKVFHDPYLCVGFRVDRWKVPAALLRDQLRQATEELLASTGREKLTTREKDELKTRLTLRLKKKTLPTTKNYDLAWNQETGVVLFWNQSPRVHEELAALFEATFGLDLVAESPLIAAVECGLSDPQMEAFGQLEESSLFKPRAQLAAGV